MADLYVFEGVSVVRNGAIILGGVTATVPNEGITAIVGPSGSGKTTLLRLCNRLEVPATGRVVFRGTDIARMDPLELRRYAGMVFQRPTLFGGTVRDNLLVARGDASQADLEAALARAELAPSFLDRIGDDLSGGEAQRACLARSLLAGPEVLLFDEVTSSLDATPRRGIEDTAVHLADAGIPVLWVTHDLAQAMRIANNLIVVIDGTVRYTGPSEAVESAAADVMDFLRAG